MWSAFFIIAIMMALGACGVLLLVWYRQQRSHRQMLRAVRMEDAWQSWLNSAHLTAADRASRELLLTHMAAAVRESVHRSLLELELRLQADPTPLTTIRKELMDSVDRRVLNTEILGLPEEVRTRLRQHSQEMLQSDAEARTYIAANELRMLVLREYAALRFGDRAAGDWFDVYVKASSLRQRSTRLHIKRTLNGSQSTLDDIRYQTITRMDQEIRARLLQVPAGTRFPGFNQPLADGDEQR